MADPTVILIVLAVCCPHEKPFMIGTYQPKR